jgi:demethylmenaquinone methyltransferase/2-methoxy-6-polyprenyl-1,4-benzoquinol methylase
MRGIVPRLTRLVTGCSDSQLLWKYYWDTIEFCVPPRRVLKVMEDAGFDNVAIHTELGIFSEYTSAKPMSV